MILQCCQLLTHFTCYSGVFIIDLQQVSAGWDMGILKHVKANVVWNVNMFLESSTGNLVLVCRKICLNKTNTVSSVPS